ncbi:MAG: phage integrase N-terminal SAM-like domain-containing protein [Agathobacter sp.]|nr:phage integrase N-terminal SAM-like domain-containing protein [Agathobacter sp.]
MVEKEIYVKLNKIKKNYENDLKNSHFKDSSIKSYMYDINIFIEYILDNTKIKEFTEIDSSLMQDFFDKLFYERKNSKRTMLRKYNTLNNFFYFCTREGHIKKNPIKTMNKPEYDIVKIPVPTNKEINKLIENAISQETLTDRQKIFSQYYSFRDIAIISLLITTGIGVNELTQLDLDDLYLKENIIRTDKNTLYINSTTKKHLQKYIEEERQSYDDDLRALFISSRGVRTRLSIRSVQRIIKKYSTNINENLSPQTIKKMYNYKYTGILDTYKVELKKQLSDELEKIVITE